MKNLFVIVLVHSLLISAKVYGQGDPPVGSKEYQEWKSRNASTQSSQVDTYSGNYLKLNSDRNKSGGGTKQRTQESTILSMEANAYACQVEDPTLQFPDFVIFNGEDDGSTTAIPLPFSFDFYGDVYDSVFVNNNGNISFLAPYMTYSPSGFPNSTYNMIAPFWADVDTRHPESGKVYYKVEENRFTVIWYNVGYYDSLADKRNTFKLVISDGTDASIGLGNNVAFVYGDMQWATGDYGGGLNGFGGTPATVGINKGEGTNDCFFFQLGRFDKPGTEYYDPYSNSGVDYLDYKCFYYDISQLYPIELDFSVNQFQCGLFVNPEITNLSGCDITSIEWDFGDGTGSGDLSPIHGYQEFGTYTIGLTVHYTCGACNSSSKYFSKTVTMTEQEIMYSDSVINIITEEKEKVLNAHALGYSETWTPEFIGFDPENGGGNYYRNAIGNWKPDKNYFYDNERGQSDDVDISRDGTFKMEAFNWQQSSWAEIPQWIRSNTITGYTSSGYEKESRNVLGIYSSAVYGYNGELVTAEGVNTKQNEMAFTGFEHFDDNVSGNWQFGPREGGTWNGAKVNLGNRFFAVVEEPLSRLQGIDTVTVVAKVESLNGSSHFTREKVPVLCKILYEEDPRWSVLVLGNAPSDDLWTGALYYKTPSMVPSATAELDSTFSHTGRASLKVSGDRVFEQSVLKLDTARVYHISAWMSNRQTGLTPSIGGNAGMELLYSNKEGTIVDSVFLQPSGTIIEGWQQVKGTLAFPGSTISVSLKFSSGDIPDLWVDDLRLFPEDGGMKSYVYETETYLLNAVLDEENFATFYHYDEEGKLYLVKKETVDGIKTVTESVQYQIER